MHKNGSFVCSLPIELPKQSYLLTDFSKEFLKTFAFHFIRRKLLHLLNLNSDSEKFCAQGIFLEFSFVGMFSRIQAIHHSSKRCWLLLLHWCWLPCHLQKKTIIIQLAGSITIVVQLGITFSMMSSPLQTAWKIAWSL